MQGFATRINNSIASSYSVSDGSVPTIATGNISVESGANPLQSSDHAYRIVDDGAIPTAPAGSGVVGMASFGENVVYLNQTIMSETPATTGEFAGTGKSASGGATLERTSAHETGHSTNLTHPNDGASHGNLMNQTRRHDVGMQISPLQVREIKRAYNAGELNQGRQKY